MPGMQRLQPPMTPMQRRHYVSLVCMWGSCLQHACVPLPQARMHPGPHL
jgi:hypothetical protein